MKLDSVLEFSSGANGNTVEFINDAGGDLGTVTGTFTNNIEGLFRWDSSVNGEGDGFEEVRGDAFAWANLLAGNDGHLTFTAGELGALRTDNGLALGSDVIQFLSWTGTDWVKVGDPEGLYMPGVGAEQNSISWLVIPLPGPAAMAMAGLGGIVFIRRRKI